MLCRYVNVKVQDTVLQHQGGNDDDEPTIDTEDILVRYYVQEDKISDADNVFSIRRTNVITRSMILRDFPLYGDFHFRFKAPDPEFGSIWVDLPAADDHVPLYNGMVHVKILKLPVPARPVCNAANGGDPGGLFAHQQREQFQGISNNSTTNQRILSSSGGNNNITTNGTGTSTPRTNSNGSNSNGNGSSSSITTPVRQNNTSNNMKPSSSRTPHQQPDLLSAGGVQDVGDSFGEFTSFPPMEGGGTNKQSAPSSAQKEPFVKAEDMNRGELIEQREEKKRKQIEQKMDRHKEVLAKEEADKKDRVEAGNLLKPEMDAWALHPQEKTWRDVRTLLATLHEVLWPGANWKPVSLGDLMLNPNAVRKTWQKAILITHPDKHNDADGKRRYRAERIFEAINESFKNFKPA